MTTSALLLSDAHLSASSGRDTSQALAGLLREHADCELVLVGDILDLSLFPAPVPPEQSVPASLRDHSELLEVLRSHVRRGSPITLIPGNHDAGLATNAASYSLKRLLNAPDDRQISVSPWFVRRGSVHIEHGHLYDPDCAPNHPLAPPDAWSEGLGTALMRRFVAPNNALVFAHAHTTTPVAGLRKAFTLWGPKAPLVIARYFQTALSLCAATMTDRDRFRKDAQLGTHRISEHAAQHGLLPENLACLLDSLPPPTHQRFADTFFRLYFDRIFASTSLTLGLSSLSAAGLGLAALGPLAFGSSSLLTALGATYLAGSLLGLRRRPRYAGPVNSLSRAAQLVKETTSAELVVFGHTHVEVDEPSYVNLGSFGFGDPGRPYLLVSPDGRPERRHTPRAPIRSPE